MSFSSDIKNDIIKDDAKSTCCSRATLYGVLASKASVDGSVITFNLETDEQAHFVSRLIKDFLGRDASVSRPRSGGRCRVVSFDSATAAKYIASLEEGAALYTPKCKNCTTYFARGIFFACGRVSDPDKQYSLDLSPVRLTEKFKEFFLDGGVEFKSTLRMEKDVLYTKKSAAIEDFFAILGMNEAAFKIMNKKIDTEMRMAELRATNCDILNIAKAVNASQKYCDMIARLASAGLLSSLPEELEKTARLRLENPALSLKQLAAISVPAITKSGLIHRLRRIEEYASSVLDKK